MRSFLWLMAGGLAPWFVGCTLATDGSSLSEGCPDGSKECDGECVDLSDDSFGCGRASCSPCALPHSVAGCSAEGQCVIASCVGSWEDCDRDPENGCEVNLETDVMNCGECGEACPEPEEGEAACAQAQCYVRACEHPWFDCNFEFRDGCERDLDSDEEHCGECDNVCESDEVCVEGACVIPE